MNFCGLEVAHTVGTDIVVPHIDYVRGLRGELSALGIKPDVLSCAANGVNALLVASEAGIECLEVEMGLDVATAFADLLVGAMEGATLVRSPDLELDDVELVRKRWADRSTQQLQRRLKTGTVKDLLRSFKTSVPCNQTHCGGPGTVCKYLLYVITLS